MLKFIKGHLESIDGVTTYPLISLVIFFVFFALLFWWVFTARKAYIDEVSALPLEDNNQNNKLEL
ncbi:CcoQ/FixQ family Cbb3-type cytochrome c oxidase assembly chaperone [Maribacter polysaccharolyticus]|uniref:CcoQ/FixQ family Cbb3-type cytochrome c oxidase assembly chaperone n=1 Tax=Maribacter polysaccharolyticus TaxID=3020831 RepID=UPI00237FB730|nr:CcoQ/FixQ family Cbb3-type cytochrome c oxidase assembly chaperone [Maribacter polysaccharolyticus]MDE3742615.1 CcoQ/FixQ family Cbb3-type cytochrome c oxidase assembly chaperone [Maribacter polysaccharolyticus]